MNYNPKPSFVEWQNWGLPERYREKAPLQDYQSLGRPSGMIRMTVRDKVEKAHKANAKYTQKIAVRDKTCNIEGKPYENREGKWTALNKAVRAFGIALQTWLTAKRCEIELSILNYPGKRGPKYKYPPSLIKCLCYLKEDHRHSYRRAVADPYHLLESLGLEMPDHSTLHKNESCYFKGSFGKDVMTKAGEILASMGIKEVLDPCDIVGTGVCPDYRAPLIIIDSEATEELQRKMNEEAEKLREMMEVCVFGSVIKKGDVHVGAVDGSGVGISGPGIYFEYMWNINNRRFIKQHVLLDVHTMEVLSFSITLESPGDAAVFAPLVEGAAKAMISMGVVYADSAYDTIANWHVMEDNKIQFYPNLKKNFGNKPDLEERNSQKAMADDMGKKAFNILTGYNIRWLVEVFFSVIKKLFGDKVSNRNFDRMVLTMRTRYELYMIRQRFMNKVRLSSRDLDKCPAGA